MILLYQQDVISEREFFRIQLQVNRAERITTHTAHCSIHVSTPERFLMEEAEDTYEGSNRGTGTPESGKEGVLYLSH